MLLLDGSALVDEAALEGPSAPAPVDHLLLRDGEVVARGRLDLYSRKQEWVGLIELVGGDVDHVLARHDGTRLREDVDHRVRDGDAVDVESVHDVAGRAVGDDGLVQLHSVSLAHCGSVGSLMYPTLVTLVSAAPDFCARPM